MSLHSMLLDIHLSHYRYNIDTLKGTYRRLTVTAAWSQGVVERLRTTEQVEMPGVNCDNEILLWSRIILGGCPGFIFPT